MVASENPKLGQFQLPNENFNVDAIQLRGVRVNNLKNIDLDIPHGQLLTVCGVSGSGKTSLAFDTLYAEGQRRYLASFSAYTRQFFEQFSSPEADEIENILPAVSIRESGSYTNHRTTVGSMSETIDYIRLLYTLRAMLICKYCGAKIVRYDAHSAAEEINSWEPGTRFLLTFPLPRETDLATTIQTLKQRGFNRAVIDNQIQSLSDVTTEQISPESTYILIDRLVVDAEKTSRLVDSLETAFRESPHVAIFKSASESYSHTIDGKKFRLNVFSKILWCSGCGVEFAEPSTSLFNYNSPLGACSRCEGFGDVRYYDIDLIVPDKTKSIRNGAIACWNTPNYAHELDELIELSDDYNVDVDVPFEQLSADSIQLIWEGVPEREFGGLNGFFAWLEKRSYKTQYSAFASRWRRFKKCPECDGSRLSADARGYRLANHDIAEICDLPISEACQFFENYKSELDSSDPAAHPISQIRNRLRFLCDVGLGYLTLNRTVRTLSRGERQRVRLTTSLGSDLVNILYVLDEPSAGLHPANARDLSHQIQQLAKRGNTVVVVEHEPELIGNSDRIVELGPAAGANGGLVVFDGDPESILRSAESATGAFLSGKRGFLTENRRAPTSNRLRISGAAGNNLQDLTVEFPLGCLCVVTGLSGAGKSTLVTDTLFPAVANALADDPSFQALPYGDLSGIGRLDEVLLIDEAPIGKSSRSNPITYVKAFDDIRKLFASTLDAKKLNLTPGHFSFNVDGGRCSACSGEGSTVVDMQFLPDVYVKCQQCQGKRYRPEVLSVKYRGLTIHDVLQMSVEKAFTFFRGQPKLQHKLKPLIDVGLGYLNLGQSANSLSTGEAQRLKMAYYLGVAKQSQTLFIMDEPTSGLHMLDIMKLLSCFDELIAVGHSIIVVEHNLQLIQNADWVIDLGPGGGEHGGSIVAEGSPEIIAANRDSVTGLHLQAALKEFEH